MTRREFMSLIGGRVVAGAQQRTSGFPSRAEFNVHHKLVGRTE